MTDKTGREAEHVEKSPAGVVDPKDAAVPAEHPAPAGARGRIVQALRESPDPVTRAALASTWPDDATKVDRCLAALVEDGLVEPTDDGAAYRLPR